MLLPLAALSVSVARPAPARAQTSADLDAVESAIDAGRIDAAREELARWFEAGGQGGAATAERVRARFLRARLSPDVDAAEADYRWVAVEGIEPWAPLARMRLAQLRLTRGELDRALEDLERLRVDYPGGPLEAESWLWSGYAHEASGDLRSACGAWRNAVEAATRTSAAANGTGLPGGAAGPPAIREAAEEALRGCDAGGDAGGAPGALGNGAAEDADGAGVHEGERGGVGVDYGDEEGDAADAGEGVSAAFTIQVGAFQSPDSAEELRDRLAARSFEVRVEPPRGTGGWYRVRVGAFGTRTAAERIAERLRRDGFPALVVGAGE